VPYRARPVLARFPGAALSTRGPCGLTSGRDHVHTDPLDEPIYKRSTKRHTEERHKKAMAKARTRQDTRRLKEKQKQRVAEEAGSGRRRRSAEDWSEFDEVEPFEKMKPSQSVLDRGKGTRRPAPDSVDSGEHADATGLVVRTGRQKVEVLTDGEVRAASLSRHALAEGLAAGDSVDLSLEPLRVLRVHPRKSVLARSDPSNSHRSLVLAANVDVCVLVLSVVAPSFKPGLIDRARVATARGGIEMLVCVNKIDLLPAGGEKDVRARLDDYHVEPVLVSSQSGAGLDALRTALFGKTCVFMGHSGVGKSSILNALEPDLQERVGDVRASDGKGQHTTTWSTLIELGGGTRVIDTPGVRTLGLGQVAREEVLEAFPAVTGLAASCRFRDCSHLVEPDCAVRAAVSSGDLSPVTFAAYERLLTEAASEH